MESGRNEARTAGILLLLGYSGAFIAPFVMPVLRAHDFPANVAASGNSLAYGALIQIFMALSCSGIAVFLYPELARRSKAWALWAVFLRSLEAVFMLLAATALLTLLAFARHYAGAAQANLATLASVGVALRGFFDLSSGVIATLAWSLGALVCNVLFFRAKLVPAWISLWGIIGAPLGLASCILILLGLSDSGSTLSTLLSLAFGLQEIPLAVYLIAKGYRPAQAIAEAA